MTEAMIRDNLLKEQFSNLVQQIFQDENESAKHQDFLQNNNAVEKNSNLKIALQQKH